MSYRVFLTHEAEKALDRLDQLAEDPFDHRLSSQLVERGGVRKSRVGGWRILYTADRELRILAVLAVGARGQVYKDT